MKKSSLLTISLLMLGSLVACDSSKLELNGPRTPKGAFLSEAVKEFYAFNSKFSIPTYQFVGGDRSTIAKGVLVYPDGSASNADEVVLSQYGAYKINYSLIHGTYNYYHEENFIVKKGFMSYSDSDNTKIVTDSIPEYAADKTLASGTYVTLAKNDTLTINEPIDFRSSTKDTPFLKGFVTPTSIGTPDFEQFKFVLTDAEDPSVYLTIMFNNAFSYSGSPDAVSYCQAGGETQTMCGEDIGRPEGQRYYKTDKFGRHYILPFNGLGYNETTPPADISSFSFFFAFDADESALYGNNNFIVDFNNDGDSLKVLGPKWNGFPSNKAYLSITCGRFNSPIARFCITSLMGLNLSQEFVEDTVGPEITVEDGFDTMPQALLDSPYKIPTAIAYDRFERTTPEVKTTVYYDYASTTPIACSVVDGKFTPKYKGLYAIVYSSVDAFNNETKLVKWVNAGDEIPEIESTIPETLLTSYSQGDTVTLPDLEEITGGVGKYTVTKSVKDANGDDVEINDDTFFAFTSGLYTVKYTITDYAGNKKDLTKQVTINNSNTKTIKSLEGLLDEYLCGYEYDLPKAKAYIFDGNGGAELVDCDVEVSSANVTAQTYTPDQDKFIPQCRPPKADLTFTFKYNGAVIETKHANGVYAKDGSDNIYLENYFVGEGFSSFLQDSGTVTGVKLTNTSADASWTYAQRLITNNFSLKLGNMNFAKATRLRITLTEDMEGGKSISITINKRVNDLKGTVDLGAITNMGEYDFDPTSTFLAQIKENQFYLGNNAKYGIKTYNDGTPFTRLRSDFVRLSVATSGSGFSYIVNNLSGCKMSLTYDNQAPEFTFNASHGGVSDVNVNYVIPKLILNDVISPNVSATMKVRRDGKILKDINGLDLNGVDAEQEYILPITQYGNITFAYTMTDGTKSGSKTITLRVTDHEAPIISLTSDYQRNAKVGDVVSLPTFEVFDNISSINDETNKLTVLCSVTNPQGRETLLVTLRETKLNGRTVVAEYTIRAFQVLLEGNYVIKITAIDQEGNSSMKQFTVQVSR